MDYLTNYYKNLCEQYEQQLDILKRRAQELKIGKFGRFGETGNNTYFKNPYIDDDNWNAMTPNPRPRPQQRPDYFNLKQPDKKTQTDDSKNWYKNFTNIFSKPKPKPEPEIEMYTRPSVGSKSQPETSSYVSDNVYSTQNTPLANRESQITSDMFDRMMGTLPPSYQSDVSPVKAASPEDRYLADKFKEHRDAALNRMIAGQKEITNIWDEAGKKMKQIYSNQQDPSKMTPEQKSEFMAKGGDSTKKQEPLPITPIASLLTPSLQKATAEADKGPVKTQTTATKPTGKMADVQSAMQSLRATLDKTKQPEKKPETTSPNLPPEAMSIIQSMLASAAKTK